MSRNEWNHIDDKEPAEGQVAIVRRSLVDIEELLPCEIAVCIREPDEPPYWCLDIGDEPFCSYPWWFPGDSIVQLWGNVKTVPCPRCDGKGQQGPSFLNGGPCQQCHGEGWVLKKKRGRS